MSELPSANHEKMTDEQAQEAMKRLGEDVLRIATRTLEEIDASDSKPNEEGQGGQYLKRIGSREDYEGPWGVTRNDLTPWIKE